MRNAGDDMAGNSNDAARGRMTTTVFPVTTLIVIVLAVAALILLVAFLRSVTVQHRRYLRAREHLGGKLLTAQDDERASIARELHDDAVPRIISCAVGMRDPAAHPPAVLIAELDRLADDLRTLARGIHPSAIDHMELDSAMRDLCSSVAERQGVRVDYAGSAAVAALTRERSLALYRVCQEALANVVRHAHVDRARVHLAMRPASVQLLVEDDGAGFDGDGNTGAGIGITSMRERVELLGGTLQIEGGRGIGTRVIAVLPLRGRA